jgi:hypothetical protein
VLAHGIFQKEIIQESIPPVMKTTLPSSEGISVSGLKLDAGRF